MFEICICDDDFKITNALEKIIHTWAKELSRPYIIKVYHNPGSLLNDITNKLRYNIYFLDIIMPGINGMELAKEIRNFDSTADIIFLTSSKEYAIESYEVKAANYLLKPLQEEKILLTLRDIFQNKYKEPSKQLQLKCNGIMKLISFDSICFIESRRNKLYIFLNTNEQLETYCTMNEMEALLKKELSFIRVHRSFLINMHYIREFSSSDIRLHPNYHVPISKNYQSSTKDAYFSFTQTLFHALGGPI